MISAAFTQNSDPRFASNNRVYRVFGVSPDSELQRWKEPHFPLGCRGQLRMSPTAAKDGESRLESQHAANRLVTAIASQGCGGEPLQKAVPQSGLIPNEICAFVDHLGELGRTATICE
jgi:hypothetical protein